MYGYTNYVIYSNLRNLFTKTLLIPTGLNFSSYNSIQIDLHALRFVVNQDKKEI